MTIADLKKKRYHFPTNTKIHKVILILMFSSLTAISAFIKVPFYPVPLTMQLFFVILSGLVLGSKLGLTSQLTYIAAGLIGLPIFANGGGINYILTPSFGYLIGFAVSSFVVGLVKEKLSTVNVNSLIKNYIACIAGVISCYIFGVFYLYFILRYELHISISASEALIKGCLIFLPGDIVKIILASQIAIPLNFDQLKKQRD